MSAFDVDYAAWKDLAIQASQGVASAAQSPDLVRLACFYQKFALREEAEAALQASINSGTAQSPLARFYPQSQ